MAVNPASTLTTSGRSAGRKAGEVLSRTPGALSQAAARTREQAEDVLAEARAEANTASARDVAVYGGLAATVVLGALELPVAAAAGIGYALVKRR
jgi:hypothetical protein